jgi:hypothetical protein
MSHFSLQTLFSIFSVPINVYRVPLEALGETRVGFHVKYQFKLICKCLNRFQSNIPKIKFNEKVFSDFRLAAQEQTDMPEKNGENFVIILC